MITEEAGADPDHADIEKARRKLDQKVAGGVLVRNGRHPGQR